MVEYKVAELRCPGCGGPTSTSEQTCKYCGNNVIITTFNSVYEMTAKDVNKYVRSYQEVLRGDPDESAINISIAMCYLRLKMYDRALECFQKAMQENFDNSETYFFAAVSLLKGNKAFLTPKSVIDHAQKYINAALSIENRGIYNYFLAYIKYDFYERKFLNVSPSYKEELNIAVLNNVPQEDIKQLFEILNVDIPDALNVN